jgi:hypothetical protein
MEDERRNEQLLYSSVRLSLPVEGMNGEYLTGLREKQTERSPFSGPSQPTFARATRRTAQQAARPTYGYIKARASCLAPQPFSLARPAPPPPLFSGAPSSQARWYVRDLSPSPRPWLLVPSARWCSLRLVLSRRWSRFSMSVVGFAASLGF